MPTPDTLDPYATDQDNLDLYEIAQARFDTAYPRITSPIMRDSFARAYVEIAGCRSVSKGEVE